MKTLFDAEGFGGFDHSEPLIIDSFAGGGGASTGIEMALGRSPDIAINHSADALAMHEVNHPDTLHLSKNIWQVDPLEAVGNRRVGLAWFSPDCKHFSKAKGGRPVKRSIRDLAWVVVLWARRVRPEVIILENVEEFRDWGPVTEEGKPCAERKGQTFERWSGELKRLGYRMEFRELRACDYGAPTIRKRFFMIARRDGRPIVWPERTHGDPSKPADAEAIATGKLKPWRTAAEIIDWSLPCPSIFDTAEEIMVKHALRAIRPLADATMKRIARGVVRYVLEAKRPFVVRTDMASAAARNGVNGLDEPMRTQTTAGSHALVVPIVTAAQHGGSNRPATAPLHTITASPKDQNAIIVPSFVGCGGRAGQSAPRGGDEPTGTLTAKPDGCVVAAHLSRFTQNGIGQGLDEPLDTVMAGAPKFGLTVAHLSAYYGEGEGGIDRGRNPDRPLPTDTAGGNRHGIIAATMVQTGYGEREGQAPRALDIGKPLGTQVAGAAKHGVVAAFLAQHNNDSRRIGGVNPGRPADEPIATITQARAQQAVVAAHMMRQFGTSIGHDLDEPAHTDTATVNKSALISGFLTKYYGQGDGAAVSEPLHTDTTKDRFGLVTVEIDGETYAIADIGMRMLTPRERFRAQGFPDDYIIDRRADGTPITATVQGSCCGNSVCPPVAAALVAANCGHLARIREAAE